VRGGDRASRSDLDTTEAELTVRSALGRNPHHGKDLAK
jgi:hypothetical protein